jgi:hypothetical protein
MVQNRVLSAIDGWHNALFERNYTTSFEQETLFFFLSRLGFPPSERIGEAPEYKKRILLTYYKAAFLESNKDYFTLKYPLLESLVPLSTLFFSKLSPGGADEYVLPLSESVRALKDFVYSVQGASLSEGEAALAPGRIEDFFVARFPVPFDYAQTCIGMIRASDLMGDLLRTVESSPALSDGLQDSTEAIIEWIPHQINQIFGEAYFRRLYPGQYWTEEDVGKSIRFMRYDRKNAECQILGVRHGYGQIDPQELITRLIITGKDGESTELALNKRSRVGKDALKNPGQWYFL